MSKYLAEFGYHAAKDGTVTESYWEQMDDEEDEQITIKNGYHAQVFLRVVFCILLALAKFSTSVQSRTSDYHNWLKKVKIRQKGAMTALSLSGTMLEFFPIRVLPSKTAIASVNPTFLPKSEDEREMCARTIYCTNIDKKVTQADVKQFLK